MAATTSTPNASMRGWVYNRRGNPADILKLVADRPTPKFPKKGQILVRVTHAALNPAGAMLMWLIPNIFGGQHVAMESDFSGEVVQAGPDVWEAVAKPGTRVWGIQDTQAQLSGADGSLAEYMITKADLSAPIPEGKKDEEVAGLALVGCTAAGLLDAAGVKSGDRVFVNGASGGVGSILVQLAKAADLHVTASCSGRNVKMVKELGADEVVDYRTVEPSLPGFLKAECSGKPFDAILDCVGKQDLYDACPAYLKESGSYVSIGALEGMLNAFISMFKNQFWPRFLGGTPRKWVFFQMQPSAKAIRHLESLLNEGKLKVPIDSVYSMEDALKAYERQMSHRAQGKVIVKVQ